MKKINANFNPFDSKKVIYHAKYWEPIADGYMPPPVLVTLDPINRCNFNCKYCNAAFKMKHSSQQYSDYVIDNVAPFLKAWGVKAVCIAGGGEPMLHKRFGDLLKNLFNEQIQVGVVTNGSLINKFIEELSLCKWLGISIDAGNSEAFCKLKNVKSGVFDKVISNISQLRNYNGELEITYKYLAHPDNISSIYMAVDLAKQLGCNYFHLRPCGKTWDNLDQPNIFSKLDISLVNTQILQAKEDFEDDNFKVFGILNKFSKNWDIEHNFKKCYAVAMTAVIEPNNQIGLCCDRRGDARTVLGSFEKLEDILSMWSSKKHWDILEAIKLSDCPRCTYGLHNQVFEHFVLSDNICKNFI